MLLKIVLSGSSEPCGLMNLRNVFETLFPLYLFINYDQLLCMRAVVCRLFRIVLLADKIVLRKFSYAFSPLIINGLQQN